MSQSIKIKDPNNNTHKQISVIWKFYDPTDDYCVKKCKKCLQYIPFCSHDNKMYLYYYLSKQLPNEIIVNQLKSLEEWRQEKGVIWRDPSIQNYAKCQTKYMERHLEKCHHDDYEMFVQKKYKRHIQSKPHLTTEEYVNRIIETFRFFITSNIPMNNFYNKEGNLYFKGIMTKKKFHYLIDYVYDFQVKMIQSECNKSIPTSIMIDEWKKNYSNMKLLGITANYITNEGECKHKALGLIHIPKGDKVTIRNTTTEIVQYNFCKDLHYTVVHDTAAVMNAAFSIEIEFQNKYTGNYTNENRIDYLDEKDEEVNVLDRVPDEIEDELKKHFLFENMTNVIYLNNIACGPHVMDLIMKKSVDLCPDISFQIIKLNRLFILLNSYEHELSWKEFNGFTGESTNKFQLWSNTRFHTTVDMMIRYKKDEVKIIQYFQSKNYEIKYPESEFSVPMETQTQKSNKNVIKIPDIMLESLKVMEIMKEAELVLSSDKNESIPHMVEYIMKTLHLTIEGLKKYNIFIDTEDYIPIYKFSNKQMKFEKQINEYEIIECTLEINKGNYVIIQNGIATIEGICRDARLLLFIMYYTSKKFKNIKHDKRLLIGGFLNPHMKDLVPTHLYYEMLLKELQTIKVKNVVFNEYLEIYNYRIMNVEKGVLYSDWWENMKIIFPRLYALSIKYRSLAVSEISVERLFSVSGEIVSSKRNRLKVDRVGKISSLKYNLKKQSEEDVEKFFNLLKKEMINSLTSKITPF